HGPQPDISPPLKGHSGGGGALIIRPYTGISGDMLVAGLAALSGICLDDLLKQLNLGHLIGAVALEECFVDHIKGHRLKVDLPHEHQARNLTDIKNWFEKTAISPKAKNLAIKTFEILAAAEGAVHGIEAEKVHFHEVGALDSIVDIGLASAMLDALAPLQISSGPLPVCDGVIRCQHGLMMSPAPAVMHLLKDVPVTALDSFGETVTPTGLAFLKAAETKFGLWPDVTIMGHAVVYGTRYFPNVPNGTFFVHGWAQ
ncbi:MAG: nickel insertion protein, partial [Candidatus Adiutrix sp.]